MIKLSPILEETGLSNFYDWTREFDVFKRTINASTEAAKVKFEKNLGVRILNKTVRIRASRGYKQPVKDYTIKNVISININDYYDDWVVVLKNASGKEFFLTSGYKIKVLGTPQVQPEEPVAVKSAAAMPAPVSTQPQPPR